ncbi:MAG: hypothetical protein OEW00_08350 [candidate division Zixibacteria bacterium]|nr:hypothetical protein [candidate division Zixibacteria bacterium]
MSLRAFIPGLAAVLMLLPGCGEDDGVSSQPPGYVNGLTLMGLVDNRSLQYIQTDTTTSFDPVYSVTVATVSKTIRIAGAGDEWIVMQADSPLINLRVTDESVIQNGYWQRDNDVDSLFYIPIPPVVMMRSLWPQRSWEGFTPRLAAGETEVMLPFYYSNFGFSFTRTFADRRSLLVPAGSFETYHFSVDLFANPYDSLPAAHVDEYYAPGVGLVRLSLRGGPLVRTLSLVDYF